MTPSRSDSIRMYYSVQVTTASSRKTICFVHEQCQMLLRHALLEQHDKRRSLLTKAQNLLALLERSLRLDDHLADSLFILYDYCYCQLESAEPVAVNNALSIITTLKTTFDDLLTSV